MRKFPRRDLDDGEIACGSTGAASCAQPERQQACRTPMRYHVVRLIRCDGAHDSLDYLAALH
ncbi:MAG TPA: hypothetical protein VFM36_11860 [Thermoanaerobaculia bacterium]|nr:hypothetical protein [Thermoanaerobaculia bacterium]